MADGIVVEALHNRGVRDSAFHSSVMVVVIACTLFTDYLLYGIFFPLAAHSPAKLEGEEQLAWLYGVYALSVLLVTPLFGYLGDRIGGRATMLYGLALAACAALLFGVASNFSVLLAARLFQGAASAALWTSGLALTARHYVQRRVQMLGYAFTGGTFGSVIGPISGGFLYHLGGYRLPFLITGILIVIDAALIVFFASRGKQWPGAIARHSRITSKQVGDCAGACRGFGRIFCWHYRAAAARATGAIWRDIHDHWADLYRFDSGLRIERAGGWPNFGTVADPTSDRDWHVCDGGHSPVAGSVQRSCPGLRRVMSGEHFVCVHAQSSLGGTCQRRGSRRRVLLFGGLCCVQHLLFDRDAGNRGACFHRGPLAELLGRSTVGERNFVAVCAISYQIGRAQVGDAGGNHADEPRV